MSVDTEELLVLSRRLLESIGSADWKTYAALCDESITCFEPEARGHLVPGMEFHKYYFDLPKSDTPTPRHTTLCDPHVRLMGEAAVVSYVRLVQHFDGSGTPVTSRYEETRVWQKIGGAWKHVHFHRSASV